MNASNIIMSFFDLIPCALFAIGGYIMLTLLSKKIDKLSLILLGSGVIFASVCGVLKALYKILKYLNICEIAVFNSSFIVIQSISFVLLAVGMMIILFKKTKVASLCIAPVPLLALLVNNNEVKQVDPTMFFVVLLVIGFLGFYFGLIVFAVKMKNPILIILLSIAVIMNLAMGYLSSKPELSDWIKEGVNTVGQGSFLASMILFKKFDLNKIDLSLRK